jgi:hypothetical protein
VPDPNNPESEEALFARAKTIHPDQADSLALGKETSRFRQ